MVGFGSSFWAWMIHFACLDVVHEGLIYPSFVKIKQNSDLDSFELYGPGNQIIYDYWVTNDLSSWHSHQQDAFSDVQFHQPIISYFCWKCYDFISDSINRLFHQNHYYCPQHSYLKDSLSFPHLADRSLKVGFLLHLFPYLWFLYLL